jgi:hypothetical protein
LYLIQVRQVLGLIQKAAIFWKIEALFEKNDATFWKIEALFEKNDATF